MNDIDNRAFISLFKACFQKCFGPVFSSALSETESKHLANHIFEATGLVIGAKSLKNYSAYIADPANARKENPSTATLDTMARYVLEAPYTDEVNRKEKEAHYPWWFRYRNSNNLTPPKAAEHKNRSRLISVAILAVTMVGLLIFLLHTRSPKSFSDDFHALQEDSISRRGWMLQAKDSYWWNRRTNRPGCLSLYTLKGDNWPDAANAPVIKNLLLRKIEGECFTAEIHLIDFVPTQNWQQAGILLMEDTGFAAKSVRLSIAFNDFFGGYNRPKEIIIQGLSSGGKDVTRPEEIAHIPVLNIPAGQEELAKENLRYSALRIEKTGTHFRFLFSTSPVENFAFREAFAKDLHIQPKYIGIFALQGFVADTSYLPACYTYFSISDISCEK